MPETEPETDRSSRGAAERDARRLLRSAFKGALATFEAGSGHPYASLVTVATRCDGNPLLLLSELAVHTANLKGDPRASLLIDATSGLGDPLAGGRVTVVGRVAPAERGTARRRFLARHPGAARYADFADFAFYALDIERAHYIGGFGRIVSMAREGLLCEREAGQAIEAAEADLLTRLNGEESGGLVRRLAARLGAPAGAWRIAGIDPEGVDLVAGEQALRGEHAAPVASVAAAEAAIRALAP